jgi:hypothetical protein
VLCSTLSIRRYGTTAEHIQEAEAAFKQVATETGYQWTTAENAIKAAKKALDAGNDAEARAQAHRAMDLVEATKTQANIELKLKYCECLNKERVS